MKKLLFISTVILFNLGALAQNFQWAKGIGGAIGNNCFGMALTLDGNGNIYTTGYFIGTVDFDPGPAIFNLTSGGGSDIFIAKFDPAGNFIWAKQVGGAFSDNGYSVALDRSGNIYTAGYFAKTVDFDPGTGTSNLTAADGQDIFILKLDASGNFGWAKKIGGQGQDYIRILTIDDPGNIYATGFFENTVDFDPGTGTSNLISNKGDIFVLKLDASGNFKWAKSMGGTEDDHGNSIAVDGSGNVYTTGFFYSSVDFDPGTGTHNLTSSGGSDIYISKLDSSGNFVWAKNIGSTGSDFGTSIALDGPGNVYTGGYFKNTVDFDPNAGASTISSINNTEDAFILKLNGAGNFVWARQLGGTDADFCNSIFLDGSDNIYSTGPFKGAIDLDPGTGTSNFTSAGDHDFFISKLNSSGNFVWGKAIGGVDYDGAASISVDNIGNIYTTGGYTGTVDFNPDAGTFNMTSTGKMDIFILKLGCDIIINTQPANKSVTVNSNTTFTISASGTGATYQWQQNTGSGFSNISNGGGYSGVANDTLTITGIQLTQNNYKFRCIVKGSGCSDTSNAATLAVNTNSIGNFKSKNSFSIYPNPANNSITIFSNTSQAALPYRIMDPGGREILTGSANNKTTIDISKLTNGFYFIEIGDLSKVTFKLVKQ